MNRPSDWRQRELALDLDHSYIVQAPAGSGKTELLTQRMLGLLAHVEHPEEVVAITFTRKAAAEMSHRLVSRLRSASRQLQGLNETEELKPHEQVSRQLALATLENDTALGWDLLEQPSRLRIRTIDGLCSDLARQLPVLSGLGGNQQIATDANALYRIAATRTMAVIEDENDELQADVVRILDRYDNQYDALVELLTAMLARREQWVGHLLESRKGKGFDRHGMEEALTYLVETQLETARQTIPLQLLSELPRFYNYAISNQAENEDALRGLLNTCGGFDCDFLDLPMSAGALPHWQTMIDTLLTKAGSMRKSPPNAAGGFPAPSNAHGEERARRAAFKEDFKALLDKYSGDEKLQDVFNTIRALPSPDYEDEAWASLESLMRILLRATENWFIVMAETGEVDFGEIAARAIQSLGSEDAPSNLALKMDYRIQHLLVDEFQDTSLSQIHLLNRLTAGWCDGDGRSLFLVGDPMQSIYRFRKAEVSLFIKVWQGQLFNHIQPRLLQLSINFRSNRPVVEWVNNTFPVLMPQENDPVLGAVRYSETGTRPAVPDDGSVTLRILPERDDTEEARQVVEVIRGSNPQETIAILVRSRAHASVILAELDKLKPDLPRFRYQAINFIPLAETSLIKDLVSLTLALTQPADRLAWLAVLRSPYVGLELADMDALVAGNTGDIILDAIATSVEENQQTTLSADGRQRLQRTGPVLLSAVMQRGRQPIRSLLESTWVTLGGPACVNNESELDDASTYFDLLDALEDEDLPIDRDTLDLRLKELYAEPDSGANGKLQVLTIHTAKGLQFDRVILPGLNRRTSGDKNRLLHWFELADENKIVMSPMRNSKEKERQKKSGDLIRFISTVEKKRQELESGRLLYVATTRAIQNLHLFAAIKPAKNGEIKPEAGSLMANLWSAIYAQQTPLIQQATKDLACPEKQRRDAQGEPAQSLALPQIYRRLAADWRLPEPPDPVAVSRAQQLEIQDNIEFSWAGEDARLTGNLVHRLLQLIGEQGLETWTLGGGMSGQRGWCLQQLASQGVQSGKADSIISRATQAIENCVVSEQGQWILGAHQDAHCEYAITAVLDKQGVKNLVLDRIFVDNGIRWIIDYKTSSHTGGDLKNFLENETKRYREQMLRYQQALAITETRPIKTALYLPMLDQLLEVT